jgi:hypothetical protein
MGERHSLSISHKRLNSASSITTFDVLGVINLRQNSKRDWCVELDLVHAFLSMQKGHNMAWTQEQKSLLLQ